MAESGRIARNIKQPATLTTGGRRYSFLLVTARKKSIARERKDIMASLYSYNGVVSGLHGGNTKYRERGHAAGRPERGGRVGHGPTAAGSGTACSVGSDKDRDGTSKWAGVACGAAQ